MENDKNDIIDESNEVNESIKKRKPPLSKIIVLSMFALFCIAMSYSFYAYNDIISDFKIDFDKKDYSAANSLIVSKGNFNPAKKLLLYSDLRNYFSTYIDDLISNYKNNNISDETALSVLNEVDRYGVVSDKIRDFKKKLPILTDSANNFSLGIKLYKDKSYAEAYAAFDKVNNYDDNFLKAEEYKKEVANCIKQETLSSAEKLVSENYFSKAISLLEDNTKYYSNDKDVLSKIDEYKKDKDDFLNKDSSSKPSANDKDDSSANTASSTAASTNSSKDTKKDSSKSTSKTENGNNKSSTDSGSKTTSVSAMVINSSTINSLNLNSDTPYLVYVNLSSQKTYVYKGKKNGWTLLKNFSCSTGIKGSDTPSGIFTVKEKGDWFYSDEYKEGAKYWVQFDGNYLFHSLPYNSSKSQITDFTLGKAASHGCVRLKLEDAKWIYDNVSRGSKVIIN